MMGKQILRLLARSAVLVGRRSGEFPPEIEVHTRKQTILQLYVQTVESMVTTRELVLPKESLQQRLRN